MSSPRRIGLVMQGGAGWAGGSEYIRNLVLAFGQLPVAERSGFELHLISGAPLPQELEQQLRPHLAGCYALSERLPATLFKRIHWLVDRHLRGRPNTRFAEFVAQQRFDLLYPLTYDNQYNIGLALPLNGALGSCRWAGWIPDFQHRFMRDLFSAAEIAKRDAGIGILAREAKTIIFSSHSAAEDFQRFYPHSSARAEVLHFHTNPTAAWYEADSVAVQRQFHLPDAYFLVSNQFWQHKNHAVVWKALEILRTRGVDPTVVCTGHPSDFRNKDYFNGVLRTIHESGVSGQVKILGLIKREEQIQLMRRALAVIQPSLFEGWSTVVEDARALGKRVIASDIPVHREQNPPGCRFFEKSSAENLADAIVEILGQTSPGPDLVAETLARATAEQAMLRYGRHFLKIVEAGVRE